ncbi:MBL fold metallo-hydrolase [Flavobacterium sp.]|uniref:MBL fold metallo-hydrolase n=1 Tax=Flavobacterium sp. TaxID=239 RepID=UPI003D0F8050
MKNIASGVYHIPLMPRNSINCYLIEGVLVDAGIRASFSKIEKAIQQIPIHAHILTHAHPDHQGASAKVCKQYNIPLYCHEKEKHRAETGLATQDYPSPKNLIAQFQQKFWSGPAVKVSKTLKENDFIGNFRIIETPGHSHGHISFFREKDGVLILGDVATNMNLVTSQIGLHLPPALFTNQQEQNIRSLKKLADLNPKIIGFGHGPVLFNKDMKFERFAYEKFKKL